MQKLFKSNLNLSSLEAAIEIKTILDFCLPWNQTERELKQDQKLILSQIDSIEKIIQERLKRIPLQYILKEAYFYGLKFKINNTVLIPRPETEILIEIALQKLKNIDKPKILEIGTGSGCISISLAQKLKKQKPQIIATDISEPCLQIAQENARLHGVNNLISFELSDLVDKKHLQNHFDLLISNPPYIAEDEFDNLSEEVKKEPYSSLITPRGLECFEKIASLNLQTNIILLELDPKRINSINQLFQNKGKIHKDLNGFERFLEI